MRCQNLIVEVMIIVDVNEFYDVRSLLCLNAALDATNFLSAREKGRMASASVAWAESTNFANRDRTENLI